MVLVLYEYGIIPMVDLHLHHLSGLLYLWLCAVWMIVLGHCITLKYLVVLGLFVAETLLHFDFCGLILGVHAGHPSWFQYFVLN